MAVEEILTSRDQVIGLQGTAGAGKTTSLAAIRAAAEQQGYRVSSKRNSGDVIGVLNFLRGKLVNAERSWGAFSSKDGIDGLWTSLDGALSQPSVVTAAWTEQLVDRKCCKNGSGDNSARLHCRGNYAAFAI
jgi:hypothetical protein